MTLTRHLPAIIVVCCLASQPLWAGAAIAPASTASPAAVTTTAPAGNPYAAIIKRNVFGLLPIPVVTAPEEPVDPPPKITPNGIMSIFGKLQVLFKVAVTVPGQPPKDVSHVMGEGEREDDIEVQKIDDKSATVTFNNHGVIQELSLVSSSAAPSAGSAPAATGFGRPGMPPGFRVPTGFGAPFSQPQNNPGLPTPAPAAPPIASSAPPPPKVRPEDEMTPETQVIMIEAQRLDMIQKGDPTATIMPITPMTAEATGANPDGTPATPPAAEPANGPGE